jgi:hypothetical protein
MPMARPAKPTNTESEERKAALRFGSTSRTCAGYRSTAPVSRVLRLKTQRDAPAFASVQTPRFTRLVRSANLGRFNSGAKGRKLCVRCDCVPGVGHN